MLELTRGDGASVENTKVCLSMSGMPDSKGGCCLAANLSFGDSPKAVLSQPVQTGIDSSLCQKWPSPVPRASVSQCYQYAENLLPS